MKTAKKAKAKPTKCDMCGEPFSGEDIDHPFVVDGEVVCEECHHEHCEFTCCKCANYGDAADQHNLLVVFEEQSSMGGDGKVQPGVYRVTGHPYHGGFMIGSSWLYSDNLECIADVNPGMDSEGYSCGHLCLKCQGDVLAQFVGECCICTTRQPSCLKVKLGSWKDYKANKYQWTKAMVVCAKCRHDHKGAVERQKPHGKKPKKAKPA